MKSMNIKNHRSQKQDRPEKELKPERIKTKTKIRSLIVLFGLVAAIFCIQEVATLAQTPDSFVVGIPGRTGCLVCHGDPKIRHSETRRSLYISQDEMSKSSHKDIACTKCHTDFNQITQGHSASTADFKRVAGLACKNCHEHAKVLKTYSRSLHGRLALGGDPKMGATCADCHGGHDIKSLKKNKDYQREFHLNGEEICGKCHKEYFDSYNDYYHGKAYKMGALDAPACWDCHGAHDVLPKDNSVSKISDNKLAKTCGTCHVDNSEGLTHFKSMIHGRQDELDNNIVIKYKNMVVEWFNENVLKKVSALAGDK